MALIGRPSNKKMLIPSNKNMSKRVEKTFEAVAKNHALKYSEALKIDSPAFAFWHNTGGSIPCSCSHNNFKQSINPGGEKKNKNELPKTTVVGVDRFATHTIKMPTKNGTIVGPLDSLIEKTKPSLPEGDILEAFEDDDDLDEFSIFNRKLISCPICLGSGKTDAWQLHGGARLVFDTSQAGYFTPDGVAVDYTQAPNKITFSDPANTAGAEKASILWAFNPPLIWLSIPRVAVWNGDSKLDSETYSLEWSVNRVNFFPISSLEESYSVIDGQTITLRLKTVAEKLQLTHVELIFSFAQWGNGHLAEVPQAYEEDFLDFQATVGAEVPPETNVSEGDYLCETKYSKIWKISSINRRKTSKNTIFGLSLDLKGLQTYEVMFKVLNLWG